MALPPRRNTFTPASTARGLAAETMAWGAKAVGVIRMGGGMGAGSAKTGAATRLAASRAARATLNRRVGKLREIVMTPP